MNLRDHSHYKAHFPLGEFVRANRLFSPYRMRIKTVSFHSSEKSRNASNREKLDRILLFSRRTATKAQLTNQMSRNFY